MTGFSRVDQAKSMIEMSNQIERYKVGTQKNDANKITGVRDKIKEERR